MRIFDGRHPSTSFRALGDITECLGRDEPRVIEMLGDDGFEKILEVPLEATNVWIRLYCRFEDLRARILFLTMDPDGTRRRYCFPLTGLKIIRKDSCLQLCRVNRKDGGLDLWARLRFPLYERTFANLLTQHRVKLTCSRYGALLQHYHCTETSGSHPHGRRFRRHVRPREQRED